MTASTPITLTHALRDGEIHGPAWLVRRRFPDSYLPSLGDSMVPRPKDYLTVGVDPHLASSRAGARARRPPLPLPLWHDPRRRQCALASVTSVRYRGERAVKIAYVEPAGELAQRARPGAGA